MLDVKYAGFGGYMEVPCYEDENGKLYFDENNGIGGLNLYTGAYRDEFGDILGEPDKKVTEDVRCAEPFARHTRENDYRMLGRLKQDCEYFLGYGAGNEDALYYKNVAAHCDAMEKLWNSFSEADKPEWLSMEDINEYRHVMTKALEDKEKNNLTACVDGLTAALGTEFADCEGIERSCVYPGKKRTKVYYCHPYASCERGSNENGNRMIRRKIPKGTSINGYSEEEIQQIEDWVNEYPRRMFGYRSSKDLYKEEMKYLI